MQEEQQGKRDGEKRKQQKGERKKKDDVIKADRVHTLFP